MLYIAQIITQVSPEFLGNVVMCLSLLSGGGVMGAAGLWWYSSRKGSSTEKYVTHGEFTQLSTRMDRIEAELKNEAARTDRNLKEIFQELRNISRSIGRIEGKQLSSD